jgi:hypothetical protein
MCQHYLQLRDSSNIIRTHFNEDRHKQNANLRNITPNFILKDD